MSSRKRKSSGIMRLFKWIGILLGVCILAFGGLVAYLTVTEYYPREELPLEIAGEASKAFAPGDSVKVMTWNVGYGALGDNADFFMDGGKHVQTADKARVEENLLHIEEEIKAEKPDFLLLQETDRNSTRSCHVDETARTGEAMGEGYQSTFASNFKVPFVPYPLPPIGKVDSGLLTLSAAEIQEALRVPLPCPFSWPVRVANLKRCLAVNRIPLEDSEKELVLVNLHLEAYDSGEGKIAQTKQLMEFLQQEADAGNYVIAGGDFNQSFSNVDISGYPAQEEKWQPGIIETEEYEGSWQFLMDDKVPSCRSLDQAYKGADPDSFQYYLLDGFLVSSNIEVSAFAARDLGFVSSDHNPVVLEAILK